MHDFDKSFKRTERTVFFIIAVQFICYAALVGLIIFGAMRIGDQIQKQGGLGKSIGSFIGEVKQGASEAGE